MIYRYKELFPPSNRWLCTKYRPHTGHLPAIHMKSLINTVQTETDITAEPSLFRGTCGYLLCKEDKNCSHLHLHVYRMYCGNASKPNQSACCYTVVVSYTENLGSFPTNRQLCSGIPSSQTYSRTPQNSAESMTRIMCRTLRRRYESRRFSLVSEEQLGQEKNPMPLLLPNMNETTKKVRRVLDINA